jgi:hypothetical protein
MLMESKKFEIFAGIRRKTTVRKDRHGCRFLP